MNAEQKQRARTVRQKWGDYEWSGADSSSEFEVVEIANAMAALLQELIDAPEAEPVAWLHIPHDHLKDRIQSLASTVKYSEPAVYAEILPCYAIPPAPPVPSVPDGWRSAIAKEFPLYDEDEIDEDKHCCEWVMLQERKRLHKILAAAPTPAEAQADVARLDWLVASDWYIGPEYGADEAGGIVGYDNKNIDGLRAAIDAAMSEKGQQA